ncbi:glycosyltransferase family 87 protein [Kiloniella sp.]|uniref:glycosyltransferase family 87 protein n=1 Tax=Kiloniella sp. TaxID=1938587 RepID=UPI003B02D8DD
MNPPFAALIYAPFAKLPYISGFILWQIFNFGLLVFSVVIVRRELTALQTLQTYKIVGCCLLFYPTLGWILYGQATPIILLLYCSATITLAGCDNHLGRWI